MYAPRDTVHHIFTAVLRVWYKTYVTFISRSTYVSESEIDQISFYLKHENGIKIARNFSASEILMSLTWAIIVEPDMGVIQALLTAT